jgi:hypothetical protein
MTLPECHSRRALEDNVELFFCAHPAVHAQGDLVAPEQCAVCSFRNLPAPATFRAFNPRLAFRRLSVPCVHLGDLTGLRPCEACCKTVHIKVYACSHPAHVETTLAECRLCDDYEPVADESKSEIPIEHQRVATGH